MTKRVKVAVTGAAGQIGYALLFRIANGDMFGKEVEVELQLLELEQALPALHGVAMELDDCAFPLLRNIVCTSNVNEVMRNVNWAVLVGSMPRKAGMERADLLNINGKIFTTQGKAINDHAAEDVRVFVVGNPCNTNCLIAMNNAKDVPNDRFFAMTMLDHKRAVTQLAKKAGAHNTDVMHMAIWGNHSSTQYPDFYNSRISGKPVVDIIKDERWLQNDFISIVQQRGAEVIKARGASSAASAANAAISSVYHITHNTPADEIYSVALCSEGEYGIDKGLIFSYPCRTENDKVIVQTDFKHNQFAQSKIKATLEELRQECDMIRKLNLIE